MRSLLFPSLIALAAFGCSQNPHVDVSNPPAKITANAIEAPAKLLPVENSDENCPNGSAGCVAPSSQNESDRDQDGVPDQYDKCPDIPGQIFNDGCPSGITQDTDRDHDGTLDNYDKCPDLPGQVFNDGCPRRREEERRVLLEVRESLKFEFDRATIMPCSFPALMRLGYFLRKYPRAHIRMVGHTDDVGSDEYNMGLSEARVFAVRDFLVDHGIAEYRIFADFRGAREPLVRVEGLEGEELERARAKNRRVDMSIRYQAAVR